MKYYKYYLTISCRCERVAGLVIASNIKEANEKVRAHYQESFNRYQIKKMKIEEVTFSGDGLFEVYFG